MKSKRDRIRIKKKKKKNKVWSNKCTCAENSRKFKKIGFFVHFSLFYKVKFFRK